MSNFIRRQKRIRFSDSLLAAFNIQSEREAHFTILSVYNYILEQFTIENLFLQKREGKIQISFIDIIVYSFLKEGMVLLKESLPVSELLNNNKYAPLRSFITEFETAVESDLIIGDVQLTKLELERIAEKYVTKSKITTQCKELMESQIKSGNDKGSDTAKNAVILVTITAFLAFFNIIR